MLHNIYTAMLMFPSPDQPWTGSSGPLDPAQQHAYDALAKVTQERDEETRRRQRAEAEVARLRPLLAQAERKRDTWDALQRETLEELSAARIAMLQAQKERDEASEELARLREQTTPRTYKAGDPVPGDMDMVWWWNPNPKPGEWRRLRGRYLDPGDLWLPMPPPKAIGGREPA